MKIKTNSPDVHRGKCSILFRVLFVNKDLKLNVCCWYLNWGNSSSWWEQIVFGGAKREVKKLSEEFKGRCVVASSSNAWMNDELTKCGVQCVLGSWHSPDAC